MPKAYKGVLVLLFLLVVLILLSAVSFYVWKRQHIISKDEEDDNLLYPTEKGFFSLPRKTKLGDYVLTKWPTVNLLEVASVHDCIYSSNKYRMDVSIWVKPSLQPHGVVFCQPRYVAKSCLIAILQAFRYYFDGKSEGQEGDVQSDKMQRVAKMRKMRPGMATSMHTAVNVITQFGCTAFMRVTILDTNTERNFPKMTIEAGDDELKELSVCHHVSKDYTVKPI